MKNYTFEQFRADSAPVELSPARVKPPVEIVDRWVPLTKWTQQRNFELVTPKAAQKFVTECMQETLMKPCVITINGLSVKIVLGSEKNPDTDWCFSVREIIDDIYRDTFYLRGA